jgi:hypothetical protein
LEVAEDVLIALESGQLLDIIDNPNKAQYPHQQVFVIAIHEYIYLVPFIEDDEKIFLKTIIPSRKAVKEYFK